MNAVRRAYELAQSGDFENFSQIKHALRREFYVERDLVGRQLAADLSRICKEARASRQPEPGDSSGQPPAAAVGAR